MNAQEIFWTVKDHLLKQNERAAQDGRCQYRTDNGLKCAVGCLIPDQLYKPEMEGRIVDDLFAEHPAVEELLGSGNHQLLRFLQGVHDCDEIAAWPPGLRAIADQYGLAYDRPAVSVFRRLAQWLKP